MKTNPEIDNCEINFQDFESTDLSLEFIAIGKRKEKVS